MDDEDVKRIAKLEVREYFDHYLTNVLPEREKALRAHAHRTVEAHNDSRKAHGGVEGKVNKFLWVALGSGAVGAGGLGLLQRVFHG